MSTIVSTGFQYPQTVISNGVITGNEWSNTQNLLLSDLLFGASNPDAGAASDVILGNYNFNIPQNSVITGIRMKLIGYRGPQTVPPITLLPIAVDDTSGSNEYYPFATPFEIPDEDVHEYIIGDSSNLFAVAWTVDQINNLKIGMEANGEVYVDTFLVEVYYYDDTPVTPVDPDISTCENCQMPLQVPPLRLAKPFNVGDTTFTTYSFRYADGRLVQETDVTECGFGYIYLTFDQSKIKQNGSDFMENARCYSWTHIQNDQFTVFDLVDVTNRALDFKLTGAHNPDLQSDHQANTEVVLSDSVPMMANYVRRCQEGVVFSPPVIVQDEGVSLSSYLKTLNFIGAGVFTENDISDPTKKNVYIVGAGGTTPPQVVNTTKYTSFDVQVPSGIAVLNVLGLNRGAVVQVLTEQLAIVTSVEVGGVACTLASSTNDVGSNQRNEIWYCVNPPLGAQIVEVTLDQDAALTFGAEALAQIDTTDMIGTIATPTTGVSLAPSISLTTDRDNSIIIDSLGTSQTPILYTVGVGQGLNWEYRDNNVDRQGASSVESAGLQPDSVTMSYAITQNTRWTMCAVEIHGIITAGVAGVTSIIAGTNVTISSTGPGGTGDVTINSTGGGGGNGELIQKDFTQVAHGLSAGEVVGSNNNASEFQTVTSNFVDNAPVGFVTTVIGVDDFTVTYAGMVVIPAALLAGFADGDLIFHSTTVSGGIQQTAPTPSQVTLILGEVIDAATGLININIRDAFTGDGSSTFDYNNINDFDDFISSYRADLGAGDRYLSGNFKSTDPMVIVTSQEHPGILRLDETGNSAEGYSDTSGNGLVSLTNDFTIELLQLSKRAGSPFSHSYGLDAVSGVVFIVTFDSATSATKVVYDKNGSTTVTTLNLPTSDTWFRTTFSWVASTGVLTVTVNGTVIYNTTWALAGRGTTRLVLDAANAGGSGNYLDTDYSQLSYITNR